MVKLFLGGHVTHQTRGSDARRRGTPAPRPATAARPRRTDLCPHWLGGRGPQRAGGDAPYPLRAECGAPSPRRAGAIRLVWGVRSRVSRRCPGAVCPRALPGGRWAAAVGARRGAGSPRALSSGICSRVRSAARSRRSGSIESPSAHRRPATRTSSADVARRPRGNPVQIRIVSLVLLAF